MGICLGMQWLFEASAEAPGCPGLGLLPGCCYRIAAGADSDGRVLKVPHVGWNSLTITRPVDVRVRPIHLDVAHQVPPPAREFV